MQKQICIREIGCEPTGDMAEEWNAVRFSNAPSIELENSALSLVCVLWRS